MNIVIIDSKGTDIKHLVPILRDEDKLELQKLGINLSKDIFKCYRRAVYRKTAYVDGELAAMFGVCGTPLGPVGYPYLLTTHVINTVPVSSFIKHYRKELRNLGRLFDRLEVSVDTAHYSAIRVLKLLGFKIGKPEYVNGHMFNKCVLGE